MPTYDYECPACGVFEVVQSITAEPLKKCPKCNRKVRRLIGAGGGLLFKGSGFYTTDYRSEEYKKQAKSETKAGDSAASKAETSKAKPDKNLKAKPDKKKRKNAS